MKYTVKDQFFNFNNRGDSKLIKIGTELSEREYNKLTPAKQAKCEPKERVFGDQWLYEEDALVGHAYDEYIEPSTATGENDLVNYLMTVMNRTKASLHMKIAQIKQGDTFYNGGRGRDGLQGSNQIHQVMMGINPVRYQF